MKILVCGGRTFSNVALIWRTLDDLQRGLPEPGIRLVIDGASDDVTGPYIGADFWGHWWAVANDIETVRVHADWDKHGRSAGPIRNRVMIERHRPGLVVAFPGGRGTRNMMEEATFCGVEVRMIRDVGR